MLVTKLPRKPDAGASYWLNSPNGRKDHLHNLFRFPARFHPPIVRWALDQFRGKGIVVDPFTGSGTVQLEALARGVSSLGIDVDPLSCMVARAKTTPLSADRLKLSMLQIESLLAPYRQLHSEEEGKAGADIDDERFRRELDGLWVPAIPSIEHWFRRYVICDLGRIFWAIESAEFGPKQRRFFRACAASVVRRVSNADPAPVSGLEVTTIQAERNKKRKIKVFDEFAAKVAQGTRGMETLEQLRVGKGRSRAQVLQGDTLDSDLIRRSRFDAPWRLILTSPPYCRAVEYSRRHRLEMYWLQMLDEAEQSELPHRYIGRRCVRQVDWDEEIDFEAPGLNATVEKIQDLSEVAGRAVRHYFYSMNAFLEAMAPRLDVAGKMVLIVGDSIASGVTIPTGDFIADLGANHLDLRLRFSYALRNHYMQYGLWNGAGVKTEHVLVFERKKAGRRASATNNVASSRLGHR